MSSLVPTTQELNAEVAIWMNDREIESDNKTESAQDVLFGYAQKVKVPALSADKLDALIDDALDDNYFEWLYNTLEKSKDEKLAILFDKKQMVIHAYRLATDEHRKNKAETIHGTINSMEMELV